MQLETFLFAREAFEAHLLVLKTYLKNGKSRYRRG